MKLIPFLNEQYNELRKGLKAYIADYDNHGDDWRMAEASRLLDILRHVQQINLNIIYPEVARVDAAQPLLEQASIDNDIIDMSLETLINVHVDEPKHEYYEKLKDLTRVVEKIHEKDVQILDAYRKNVPADRQQEIDRLFHQKIMRETTITPLV